MQPTSTPARAQGRDLDRRRHAAGIDRQTIHRVEHGRLDPSSTKLLALCLALRVSADAMLGLRAAR